MSIKQEKQIASILDLFNSFDFIQPKLGSLAEFSSGIALQQMLQHFFDIDVVIDTQDNWELQLKVLKEIWEAFESKLQLKSKPNFLQIVKNCSEQFILEMIVILLQGIINSSYSQVFVQQMILLDQETQLVLLKLIQDDQQQWVDQNSKISEEVLHKFEELEYENQKLNQEILIQKQEFESERKQHQENIDSVKMELERAQKNISQLNEELNTIYDLTQTSSVNEVCEYIHNRIEDIKAMQNMIQTLQHDQAQEKEVHEEIVKDLRSKLEGGHRKLIQMQKLEKYCEQLKTQLTESLQEQTKNKENLKLNSKLKEENNDLNAKVASLQQKLDQQKQLQKQNLKIQNQQEFDISKARSENESLSRQLKLREQEIFKLKHEIIELEHVVHNKTEQSQLENSSMLLHSLNDGEERRNFSGIFTPKRNLGLELSQLITKSNYLIEGDHKLKLDVHTQTEEFTEGVVFMKKQDSSFDEEIMSSQLSFWKTQCQDLLAEKALYEEKQNQLHREMQEVQIKLEQFFNEQHKYELELQEAREKVLNLIEENNVITSQFEQSLQKIAMQDKQLAEFPQVKQQLEDVTNKLQKSEEQLLKKKKKKVQNNQSSLMNKQLEITKRTYEELLQMKQEELQLLAASLQDIIINYNFLGTSARFIYVFHDRVIVNKDQHRKKADRAFNGDSTRILWKYTAEQPIKLKGIIFDCGNVQQEYLGEDDVLRELKKHISKLYFQAKVQEEYVAMQVIGQGNYALVLELKHLHSDLKFASKCIDKKKLQTIEQGMESVLNEIKIMRLLSPHDQLINLREVYEGDNNIYLVMDLAQGGSLYKEMKNKMNLYNRSEVQKIMYQILLGLQYIHSKNIMHRDLKPENILFMEKGNLSSLRIADFGLSVQVDSFPYLYPKCGTPGFVAPEIVNLINKNISYTTACDIFSAGVIFHILLMGEGLFIGNGHQEILKMNKQFQVDFTKQKYYQLDADARDLLFHMILQDPDQRYSAIQCLQHPYFSNDMAPQYLIKMQSSPLKTSFNQYLDTYNSPDQKQMNKNKERLSIVTRTPIYAPKASTPDQPRQNSIMEELNSLSSFQLDQQRNDTKTEDYFQFAITK